LVYRRGTYDPNKMPTVTLRQLHCEGFGSSVDCSAIGQSRDDYHVGDDDQNTEHKED